MADNTSGGMNPDPLGDRLRATFEAEHGEVERRNRERDSAPGPARSLRWIPFAAAAAVIAIAGFFFIGNRGQNDQAVELDIATQPTPADSTRPATPTPHSPDPDSPEPSVLPAEVEEEFRPARNDCDISIARVAHFVWDVAATDPDGGLIAHTAAGVNEPITRVINYDEVVFPTMGCVRTANGSAWYELLEFPDSSIESSSTEDVPGLSSDWVNARYLRATEPACLVGEQLGARTSDGIAPGEEPFFYTIQNGDRLSLIAAQFNIPVAALIDANPDLDPNLIIVGQQLLVPGATTSYQILGPTDGNAVFDAEMVAFAPAGTTHYGWYRADGAIAGACTIEEELRAPICLVAEIQLLDVQEALPLWTGVGPVTAWLTGRTIAPPVGTNASELVEVDLLTPDGQTMTGFVDPAAAQSTSGHCVFVGPDSLVAQPCTRVTGADRTAGLGTDEAGRSWNAGDEASNADHVHDLRTESNAECTRLIIEFGLGANADEQPVTTLPPVEVRQGLDYVKILPAGDAWQASFDDPKRVGYPQGIGLLTLSFGYEFAVEFMHRDSEPHVRFMSDPARVVIDLFPSESVSTQNPIGPFGAKFVLRQPIQQDLIEPGVPADDSIIVEGFGRPFEASGLYRIWAVPDDVDPDEFLQEPPEPLIENFFPTGGWAEGWGEFSVQLPDLEPGSYIAVFGELPPTDEIGFYGTGQLFRVADASDSADTIYAEAVLLPDVQLPPEILE